MCPAKYGLWKRLRADNPISRENQLIVNIAFDLAALHFVAIMFLMLLSYVLYIKYRQRKIDRAMALIRSQILAFFRAAEMQGEVKCYPSRNARKFTVCIDSQPQKKFKFSNLVESVLIRYLSRTTDLSIDRVYWRFSLPTKIETEMLGPMHEMATEGLGFKDKLLEDESQSLVHAYRVAETSWDNFEKALRQEEAAKEGTTILKQSGDHGLT